METGRWKMHKRGCARCTKRTGTHHLLLGLPCCSKCALSLVPVVDLASITGRRIDFFDDLLQLGVFWNDDFLVPGSQPVRVAILTDAVDFFEKRTHQSFEDLLAGAKQAKVQVMMDPDNEFAPDFPIKALVRNPSAISNHHLLATELVKNLHLSSTGTATTSAVVVGNQQYIVSHGGSRKVHYSALEGKITRHVATCTDCNRSLPKDKFPEDLYLHKSRRALTCNTCLESKDVFKRPRLANQVATCQGPCGEELLLTGFNFSESTLKNRQAKMQSGVFLCKVCDG